MTERATDDERLATELAERAGAALLHLRASTGLAGRELKDAADAAAQSLLAEALATARPRDAVLSEEAADDPVRLAADRVWIIDPLDGTREFSEGRADFAVHVALWQRGRGLTAGAVAMPGAGRAFTTAEPVRSPAPARTRIRLAVSRSRPPALVAALAEALDAELVPMGSAGVKAMSVVTGETDAYVHGGGQYEWDSAAPVAVAHAAGLHTSRLDGGPLEYNRESPWLPDLVICRPELRDRLLATIAATAATEGAA
ncbi:3'(2'),5'-bisphosphate nucleotidase CysQ [Amnibacterium sp. CER49]|uniref:3'(2'),5'-bisphosphate nucleotidase CysQ n=1 Tax=Amnibacterium sp. CER49 TaxID=3039161 RepID=UPI002448DB2B|nr:3'(2'),5'-bisphosphate nucleotidase CysQ [Amnibacterium sp. CER49]MDH2443120.1 3'(2'),5'-bisphosphate nucleotidase CysQ [Amnibacterium sp. CER49]